MIHNKYEPIESETLVDFITKSEPPTLAPPKNQDDTPRQFEKNGYFSELLNEAVVGSVENFKKHISSS